MNVAIDGPAGAGKSTIAKLLAQKLGFVYLDTGAMYRAVALKVLKSGVLPDDAEKVAAILPSLSLEIRYLDGAQQIFLDGEDVSVQIRQHEISSLASAVSAIPAVRLKMVEMQRDIAKKSDVILDGRDIGTFVLPGAEFKFFLTASIETRAERRYKELLQKGEACSLEKLTEDIAKRDYDDSHRAFAPLKKADDAVEVDTSDLTVDRVVEKLYAVIRKEKK